MKAAYQIVYYVPNLVLGGKFPIGALVHEDLNTTFIKAKGLPGQNCLGGARALLFMEAMLRRLEAGAWRNGVLSHHIEYGHQVNVPRGIDKAPRRWVEDCLWPSAPPEPQHSGVGLLGDAQAVGATKASMAKVETPEVVEVDGISWVKRSGGWGVGGLYQSLWIALDIEGVKLHRVGPLWVLSSPQLFYGVFDATCVPTMDLPHKALRWAAFRLGAPGWDNDFKDSQLSQPVEPHKPQWPVVGLLAEHPAPWRACWRDTHEPPYREDIEVLDANQEHVMAFDDDEQAMDMAGTINGLVAMIMHPTPPTVTIPSERVVVKGGTE